MDNTDWQIITNVILIAIGLYLSFFKSYLGEKAKNLATKEDIGEITKTVKLVESKIERSTNNLLNYDTIKRQLILDYFGAYNNWERTIFSESISTGDDSALLNKNFLNKIYDAKYKYNLKEGEIELFIEDTQFYELRRPLTLAVLGFQQAIREKILENDFIISSESDPLIRHQKLMDLHREINVLTVAKLTEIMPLRNNMIRYLDNLIKEIMK